jgi:hypothetical protein
VESHNTSKVCKFFTKHLCCSVKYVMFSSLRNLKYYMSTVCCCFTIFVQQMYSIYWPQSLLPTQFPSNLQTESSPNRVSLSHSTTNLTCVVSSFHWFIAIYHNSAQHWAHKKDNSSFFFIYSHQPHSSALYIVKKQAF